MSSVIGPKAAFLYWFSNWHKAKVTGTINNTSSVPQQKSSFTSKFHYTEMAGPRKEFEADLNISRYALQDCIDATFRFAALALTYFNLKSVVKNKLDKKKLSASMANQNVP